MYLHDNSNTPAPASRRTRGSNTSILTIRGGGGYSGAYYSVRLFSGLFVGMDGFAPTAHSSPRVSPIPIGGLILSATLFAYTAFVPARIGYNYTIRRYAVCLWVLFFSAICAFHAHAIPHSPFFQPRHFSPVVIHYDLLFAPLTILATIAANALPIQQHDHTGSLLQHLPITSCIMHKRFLYYSRAYYSIHLSCTGASRLFVVHSHENILFSFGCLLALFIRLNTPKHRFYFQTLHRVPPTFVGCIRLFVSYDFRSIRTDNYSPYGCCSSVNLSAARSADTWQMPKIYTAGQAGVPLCAFALGCLHRRQPVYAHVYIFTLLLLP